MPVINPRFVRFRRCSETLRAKWRGPRTEGDRFTIIRSSRKSNGNRHSIFGVADYSERGGEEKQKLFAAGSRARSSCTKLDLAQSGSRLAVFTLGCCLAGSGGDFLTMRSQPPISAFPPGEGAATIHFPNFPRPFRPGEIFCGICPLERSKLAQGPRDMAKRSCTACPSPKGWPAP